MSKNKNKPRVMDFSTAVSNLDRRIDSKIMLVTQQLMQSSSVLKLRLEVLEDYIKEKFGETDASLKEMAMLRLEKQNGMVQLVGPAATGTPIRVRLKEEPVGQETDEEPNLDNFLIVGSGEIHPALDAALIGMTAGQKTSVTVPDPRNNREVVITVALDRVFEPKTLPTPAETPLQASVAETFTENESQKTKETASDKV